VAPQSRLRQPGAGRVWLNPLFDRYRTGRRIGRLAEHGPAVRRSCAPAQRTAIMTNDELIEAACEIIGINVKDLSVDQIERLTAVTQHLTDLSLNERKSFGHLCAMRAAIDAADTADDFVTLRLTNEQRAFLLALIDREIREHA
jgi:hypothetical protein